MPVNPRTSLPHSPGIDLRHLRYFLAVYDELHFGRAAEKLHIAQPPLSHAIRKIEAELGTQLLERTSRNVKATPAGRVFAEEARKVLSAFHWIPQCRTRTRSLRGVRTRHGISRRD